MKSDDVSASQSVASVNPLQRALIEKTGHDNGFEHVLPAPGNAVTLASARHRSSAAVVPMAGGFEVCFQPASPALVPELLRSFKLWAGADGVFRVPTLADLAALLRRAASLSQALPNQAVRDYHTAVAQVLADLPAENRGTEVERLVRQRVGQDRYRDALLAYWGGACAVTGVTVTETLRASHAKPWAECTDDAERLDAFNGFLLVANLDALFDRFLISFDDAGHLLISARLSPDDLHGLGIHPEMTLRWLAREHRHYLQWHRERFLLGA
ncbi:HNH endonuclease [Pseudomonas aeruginosa]|uniref:HNH endonuclease n=1 Tax=Pseudomonas aeruginosa TaxID=287 RepID=UPI003CC5EE6A